MWIFEKPTSRATWQVVSAKSASVSPGKPTMMSVVIAGRSSDSCTSRQRSMNPLAAPAAAHAAQHAVAAALHRDVQMRADFVGMVGHHGDQFAGDFGGFDAGEADAKVAGQFGDLLRRDWPSRIHSCFGRSRFQSTP